jgi:hypothetical protein
MLTHHGLTESEMLVATLTASSTGFLYTNEYGTLAPLRVCGKAPSPQHHRHRHRGRGWILDRHGPRQDEELSKF